jgi:hypothetical protein
MDGADAPNENGAGAPPNAVDIVAEGNAILEASPDVYPVSMVDVGESIPKLAPPSAIGLLGNDGAEVGVEADAAPNMKGAALALDPPKEKAGADCAVDGAEAGAGAALPNEKAGSVNPAAAVASGFEAGAAPNMKGAGVAFALGVAAGAPKVKAGADSELDGVVALAGTAEPRPKTGDATTGSNPTAGGPNDVAAVVLKAGLAEGPLSKARPEGGDPKPKPPVSGEEVTTGALGGTVGGKPNEKPAGFLVSPLADWFAKVPAPDEEGAVLNAGNNMGAGVEVTAGALKPVKVVAVEGITIAAAGALGAAPKMNGAGFATGNGSAALVLNPEGATDCGAVAVTGAVGAPKVKGAEEDEGVGAVKELLGADTAPAPLDTGPKLFSHERHFTDPLGFCTRQVWHLTRSEEAAMAQRDDLAGSVAATATGTAGAAADTGTDAGTGGAKENPTIGAGVSLSTAVGADAGAVAAPCPKPFKTVSHDTHEAAVFVFCTKHVGHF